MQTESFHNSVRVESHSGKVNEQGNERGVGRKGIKRKERKERKKVGIKKFRSYGES